MKWLKVLLALLLCFFTLAAVRAQDRYPNRQIKIIVPYAPGGATDIVARVIGDQFLKITGQPFVVLNKPGAFGMVAISELEKSAPDGYTLMLGNVSTNAITPLLYADKMTANYARSVVPVTRLVDIPAFLLVTTADNFEPKTVAELIDYAKKNPGKLRYGTVGVGSYPHFDMAYFAKRAGDLDLISLPNKNGAAGVIQDLLRGDAQAAFLNVASTAGMVKANKLRPLAVVNRTRLSEYPEIPTMQEAGFPGVGTTAWQGLFAPAGTPQPIMEALFSAVNRAMQASEARDKLGQQNFNIAPNNSLDEAKIWLTSEMSNWKIIIDEVKLSVQ